MGVESRIVTNIYIGHGTNQLHMYHTNISGNAYLRRRDMVCRDIEVLAVVAALQCSVRHAEGISEGRGLDGDAPDGEGQRRRRPSGTGRTPGRTARNSGRTARTAAT